MQRNLASWRSSTNRCVCPPTVGYLLERLFRLISIAYCRGSNLLVSPLARRLLNGVEVKNSYFNKSSPTFVQQKHSQLYIYKRVIIYPCPAIMAGTGSSLRFENQLVSHCWKFTATSMNIWSDQAIYLLLDWMSSAPL